MASVASDFVEIELSAAGVEFAGSGGVVRVTTQHFSYQVKAGAPVRVLTSEWSRVLSKESYQGQPIFCVADDAQSELDALKAQEAVLTTEIAQGKKSTAKGGK